MPPTGSTCTPSVWATVSASPATATVTAKTSGWARISWLFMPVMPAMGLAMQLTVSLAQRSPQRLVVARAGPADASTVTSSCSRGVSMPLSSPSAKEGRLGELVRVTWPAS